MAKKILNIVKNVLVWAIVILAVGMMIFTIFSVTTFDRNDRAVFGLKFYVVQTDSMAATDFKAGDLIIAKKVKDFSSLNEGDIITFISQDRSSYGKTVTHKIRSRATDTDGAPGFITYGTTTGSDDETIVTYPYILGKYTGKLPGVGKFFAFLKTTPGYIVCIFVPFVLLIAYQGIRIIRLFRQYRKDEMAEMKAERQKNEADRRQREAEIEEERRKLEADRQKTLQMMQELEALKASLSGKNENTGSPQGSDQTPDEIRSDTEGDDIHGIE
ncbi:MAG: signal peptidase I [Clostridia bacterium]|nr:signal peptidase I [Clostridia bacterium]